MQGIGQGLTSALWRLCKPVRRLPGVMRLVRLGDMRVSGATIRIPSQNKSALPHTPDIIFLTVSGWCAPDNRTFFEPEIPSTNNRRYLNHPGTY